MNGALFLLYPQQPPILPPLTLLLPALVLGRRLSAAVVEVVVVVVVIVVAVRVVEAVDVMVQVRLRDSGASSSGTIHSRGCGNL